MSKCLYKLPHSCGSSNGLQVYESDKGITGYCWACNTYVPDPLDKEALATHKASPKVVKTEEEIKAEMKFISTLPALDLDSRQLKTASLEYFGVKVGVSEYDGITPSFVYFPYTKDGEVVRYKVRMIPVKKMWAIGIEKDVDLFGWEQAKASGAKKLIITEGEFDAIAVLKILKIHTDSKYEGSIPAVVSLSNGSGGAAKEISRKLIEINKYFKEVYLCFDNDNAGKEAIDQVCKIAPKFKVINLPAKDANECLIKGLSKAAFNAITFNHTEVKNTKIIWGQDVHESAKKPAEYGFSWPWSHINKVTKGIRLGETIYIGAGQKQGKSEIVNALAAHFIREHNWPVLLIKPEEANNKTYKMVAGKLEGKVFHDPDIPFDYSAYDNAGKILIDKLAMVSLYQHIDYDTVKNDIYYAVNNGGVKAVFIDPITNLVNGMDTATQNVELQRIAQDLSVISLDLNIVIFIFCHLRNPDSGEPHERGGEVLSSQFAGSRAMARSCNLMLGLEGNRDPNLSEREKNMRTLVLLEDREFGKTGRFPLYWDDKTTLFNELPM